MTKYKKIGIILILIGICIPLIAFAFAIGYDPKMGFWWSVPNMTIILWQRHMTASEIKAANANLPSGFVLDEPVTIDVALPYKYPFSLGIISILSGVGFFALAKPKKDEKQ